MPNLAPDAPREPQTLHLPPEEFPTIREWVDSGTGLAAAARVRDPDGRIALVQNDWSDGWLLPGGTVEPGEHPADAARREVREETGLVATLDDPLVVLDQTYVRDGCSAESDDSNESVDDPNESADASPERVHARYVVYAARADGSIPDPSALGDRDDEIHAARWFDSLPDDLHDGDLLSPYL